MSYFNAQAFGHILEQGQFPEIFKELGRVINGGLNLHENFDGRYIETKLEKGRNEINHDLGRIPVGWILLSKNGPGDIWSHEVETWTKQKLLLFTSAKSLTVRIYVV